MLYLQSCKCLYVAPLNEKQELLYILKHESFGQQKICGCRNYEVLVDLLADMKQKYTFKKKSNETSEGTKKQQKSRKIFIRFYCILHLSSKYSPQTSHVKTLRIISVVITSDPYLILTGEVPQLLFDSQSVVNSLSRQKRLLFVGE